MIVGRWYVIGSYGFEACIKGKLIELLPNDMAIFKFYWGLPFRSKNAVELARITGECKRPGFFSNY